MSKKKLIRVLFLIILLQFGVYYPEFAKGAIRIVKEFIQFLKGLVFILLFG